MSMTTRGTLIIPMQLQLRFVSVLLAVSFVNAPGSAPGPYECGDGRLISPSWVCNGIVDCPDGEDEHDCDSISCFHNQFRCSDGSECISNQHVCDDDLDCSDHSDEQECPSRECGPSEFHCGNNRCVHVAYRCDNYDDCGDMSDEENCDIVIECPYRCGNSSMCIPEAWVCDGAIDCFHAYDELNCDGVDGCDRFGMFNCTKGGCVKAELVCDGTPDCPEPDDASDEECPKRDCDGEREYECHFTTGLTECQPLDWICDGGVDCFDETGSDERNCIASCEETEFSCVTRGQCVPNSVQCDGMEDCSDGSDEYLCDTAFSIVCPNDTFPCHNGLDCVGAGELCDGGPPECHDGSDEEPLWCDGAVDGVNECEGNSHGCEHHCHDTDHAYYCTCDPGYILDNNRKNCSDLNECADRSTCSQLCCNLPGSYQCHCVDGFELADDGVCKPLGRRGYLLVLDKVDIRRIQPVVDGGADKKLVRELAQTFALDYHLELERMFWSEMTYYGIVIKTAFLNGSNISVVIDTGLVSPHGLAVDWISHKIYWTDAYRAHVTVAELDGSKRNVLFSDDMKKPRGIALDPTTGYMYWTDWGTSPRIERASMDGQNRIILHSVNIVWPNALTVDYSTQHLYWIDAKLDYIESSFMDGSRRTVLYRETTRHFRPFGLTLFKDKLFMVDVDAREVRAYNVKSNDNDLQTIYTTILEPMSVVAVHPVRQPHFRIACLSAEDNSHCDCENVTVPVVNPCEIDNGGCEYMCVLSSVDDRFYSCVCPTGHRLHPNGKNCLGLDMFLLLVDNSEVYIVSLDVPHPVNVRIPLVGTDIVSGITWDSRTDTIYFVDSGHRTISSAKITGDDQQVLIDSTALGKPVGIALDWLHDRLYWTDSEWDTIESSDLDGDRRTVVVYGLDEPTDIALDPERGLMFWSSQGRRPRIMRSALDGTSKTAIVTKGLDDPNGIAVDYEKEIVYWVDGNADTLEMIHYNKSNHQVLLQYEVDVIPFGLDVYGDWLYWTTWKNDLNLQRGNVASLDNQEEVIGGLVQSRDVNVFHRHRNHDAPTPCRHDNGNCSHVCVARGRRSGRVEAGCMCPIGHPLLSDQKTCAPEINTTLLFPAGNAIHRISLDITDYTADISTPVPGVTGTITAVTMDPTTNTVYYADTATAGIHCVNVSSQTETVILNQHPTAITSLAVDSASQNLYFVDSFERRVEVASTDGTRRRVLHSGLVRPTGLAIDPVSLTLFYVDTGDYERNEDPKIYSSAMDGSAPTVIVTQGLRRPLYIAVDNNGVNGRIFWTDSYYNHIMTATFEGRNPRIITVFGPIDMESEVRGLAFFQDHIYFTDHGRQIVYRSDLYGARSIYLQNYEYLSDIQIIERNKGNIRGCINTSRCDYLCLPNPNVPSKQTCSCATGIEPNPNGTCPKDPSAFLLVAAQYSLRRIALDNPNGEYVDVPLYDARDGFKVNAVDYFMTSSSEGFVYFAEMRPPAGVPGDLVWKSRIARRSLFSKDCDNTDVLLDEVGIIEDIAVDWTTGNVYYTLNSMNDVVTPSHIAIVDMDGSNKCTLVRTGIHKPRGIALHPNENIMFWTDYGDHPKIVSARMDATRSRDILSRQSTLFNLHHPNDVVVDVYTDLVFFSDGARGLIGAVTLAGNSGRVIVNKQVDNPEVRRSEPVTSYIRKPRSLSLRHLARDYQDNDEDTEESVLFWAEPEFSTLSATDLITTGASTDGIEKSNLRSVLPRTTNYEPLAVQFVSANSHKKRMGGTPCSEGNCDWGLCVNVNSTHFQCLCPDRLTDCVSQTIEVTTPPPPPDTTRPPPPPPPTTPVSQSNETTSPHTTDQGSRGTNPSSAKSLAGDQSSKAREDSVKSVGIGLGTIVGLVLVAFVVFVVIVVYLLRRRRFEYRLREQAPQMPLRSLSSPTPPPTTTRKSNVFHLPTKQSNIARDNKNKNKNKAPSISDTHVQRVINPSNSVNEFVAEPEFYDLGPAHKPKKIQTPPDSPLLKPVFDVIMDQHQAAASYCNVTVHATVESTAMDKGSSEALQGNGSEKPTQSCLSSVSDSSQSRSKRVLSVSFAEDISTGQGSTDNDTPPPPLPPKLMDDDYEVPIPPPRPPKPTLQPPHHPITNTCNDKEGTSTGESGTCDTGPTDDKSGAATDNESGIEVAEGVKSAEVAVDIRGDTKPSQSDCETTGKGTCRESCSAASRTTAGSVGSLASSSEESGSTCSSDEARPILKDSTK